MLNLKFWPQTRPNALEDDITLRKEQRRFEPLFCLEHIMFDTCQFQSKS